LATEAFDFGDGHSFNADFAQGVFDLFKLEGFDDGFDFLHSILCVGLLRRNSEPARLSCLVARSFIAAGLAARCFAGVMPAS
jgi:hypothetical protein